MTDRTFETLSAFFDGEPIETGALAEVLAAPGAREALIDFARLRAEIADAGARETPSPEFYESMRNVLGSPPAHRRRGWNFPVRTTLAAAATLVVGVIVGLALDGRLGSVPFVDQPPASTAAEGSVEQPTSSPVVNRPPAPDREIRFVDGVDWFRS